MTGFLPVDCKMGRCQERGEQIKATKASESNVAKKKGCNLLQEVQCHVFRKERGWQNTRNMTGRNGKEGMGDFFLWTLRKSRHGLVYKMCRFVVRQVESTATV